MTPRGAWTETGRAAALVALAASATFARGLAGGFVWDDHAAVEQNPHVQHPESWLGLVFDRASVNQFGFVRPLRTLEFAADRALFGPGPLSFHVHSLLWHVVASVLLLFVLRRLVGDGKAALAGALLWAVHPVQTETVAWIACRGDVAMAACVFASALCALKSDGRDRWLAFSLACALIAPLYKETALALPLVVAGLRWAGRARPSPGGSRTARGHWTRVPVWPYLVVAAAYVAYRAAMSSAESNAFALGGSHAATVATMSRAFGFYVVETLVPAQSADWYLTPSTSAADGAAAAWLVVHLALAASAVAARRKAPTWTLAVVWFYAFLLPVSNWPGLYVGSPTAERYLYVPLAGVALAVAAVVARFPRAALPATIVVAAAATASVIRCGMWRSDDALFDAMDADHASARADEWIGNRLRGEATTRREERERLLDASLARYHRAIAFWLAYEGPFHGSHPAVRRVETNTAYACVLLGRDAEALFHADEALAIDAAVPEPHYDRALALQKLGFAPQAIAAMRRAQESGFDKENPAIAALYFEAAQRCEREGLRATARAGFASAVLSSPPGRGRDAASARLAALTSSGVGDAPDVEERARIAELDAALARTPKSCPAR